MKTKLSYALVATLLIVSSVALTRAATNQAEVEVRINAQRLEDGRTEFALQQRLATGNWGDRVLPRGRYFPADPEPGRWLNSTPINLSVPLDQQVDALSGFEVALELSGQGDDELVAHVGEGYYLVKLSVSDSTSEHDFRDYSSVSADVEIDMFDADGDKRTWEAYESNYDDRSLTAVSDTSFEFRIMSVSCREDSISAGDMRFIVNADDDESWSITLIRLPQEPFWVCTSVSE